MAGIKGRSGRRRIAKTTALDIVSWTDTLLYRMLRDETIPIEKRAAVAAPIFLKRLPERIEQVNLNLQLSPELAGRLLSALGAEHEPLALPPSDIVTLPVTPSTPSSDTPSTPESEANGK